MNVVNSGDYVFIEFIILCVPVHMTSQ